MLRHLVLSFLCAATLSVYAQQYSAEDYIRTYAMVAVSEMERSGVPASITLAQGLLESGNGNSDLAKVANNHFGIKCHKEWTGDTYYMDDDAKNECFRYYRDPVQSYIDHTDFLKTRDRYAFLFQLSKGDYNGWANGLKQAGYATNPQYPQLLINLIEKYTLNQFDNMTTDQVAAMYNSKPPKTEDKQVVIVPQKEEKQVKDFHQAVNDDPDPNGPEIVPYFGDIYLLNNIKTIKAKADDTPLKVAVQYSIPLNLLYKYNDMYEGDLFAEGQNIFLQPKRNKSVEKTYKAKAGQSMHDVSQMFGVKLASLYEKNHMKAGEEVFAGEVIQLRDERAEGSPRTRTFDDVMQERNHRANVQPEKRIQETQPQVVEQVQVKTEQQKTVQEEVSSPVTYTATQDKQEAVKATESYVEHKIQRYEVKAGDTLYNISKRFNASVDDLISWNHIENNTIHIGQQIIVGR